MKARIEQLEVGYSEVIYEGHKYSVTKELFNEGKSVKVYARHLAGNDFISFNFYQTKAGLRLKPCEMSELKVINFLREYVKIEKEQGY